MTKKRVMCSSKDYESGAGIVLVKVSELHDFKDHPFKVEQNQKLFELRQSMEKEGVLVPLLIRHNTDGDGYEIIAGHRRKAAAISYMTANLSRARIPRQTSSWPKSSTRVCKLSDECSV